MKHASAKTEQDWETSVVLDELGAGDHLPGHGWDGICSRVGNPGGVLLAVYVHVHLLSWTWARNVCRGL